jgi:long-chain acyl-CoA synthetase
MPFLKRYVTACSEAPERAVIIEGDKRIPHRELLNRSVALSQLLGQIDKSPGGHVGVLLPNTWAFPASFFGTLLAGKVAVPINVLLQPKEVAFILSDAGIQTVLTISPFKRLFEGLRGQLPWEVNAVYLDELPEVPPAVSPPPLDQLISDEAPDRLASLIYTSGTTGSPKGVMLSHGNLESNAEGSERVLELHDHQDTVIAQLPLFHSYGMMASMICPLFAQVPIVMLARFQPTQLLNTIVEQKITALFLVAPMYGLLCRHPKIREADLSALRICVSGGGPLSPSIEQAWKALTGHEILSGYGLTEASPVVANNSPRANRAGSIGRSLWVTTAGPRRPPRRSPRTGG